jgi:hypothetical protein
MTMAVCAETQRGGFVTTTSRHDRLEYEYYWYLQATTTSVHMLKAIY